MGLMMTAQSISSHLAFLTKLKTPAPTSKLTEKEAVFLGKRYLSLVAPSAFPTPSAFPRCSGRCSPSFRKSLINHPCSHNTGVGGCCSTHTFQWSDHLIIS